jgi:site-specific DNA recombinase
MATGHLKGAVCDNKPIRQDQLDAVVWQEIVRLLEDPGLLQAELDRRLKAAQTTDPLKRREDAYVATKSAWRRAWSAC